MDRARRRAMIDRAHPDGEGLLRLNRHHMDWRSRAAPSWRLSNTLHADFCIETREETLARFGAPEVFKAASTPATTLSPC